MSAAEVPGGRPHDGGFRQVGAKAAWTLGIVAIGAQIAYPLSSGTARDRLTVAVVLLLAGAAVLHALATRGPRWAGGLVLVTALGGFTAELVGTRTGWPFGEYAYADGRLGPGIGGVPVVICLAWTAGAYPAWCAARRVAGRARLLGVALAAAGLAGWDLYLDPQMVDAGLWSWRGRGAGLPGVAAVPMSNYLGWAVVALVMAALLAALPASGATGATVSDGLPHALYCWTWLGSALAHAVFLGLPASAGYGLLGMGVLGVPLVASLVRHRRDGEVPVPAPRTRPGVSLSGGLAR